MRFWLSGPRMFNGLVRPGVSFSDRELAAAFHPRRTPAGDLDRLRKAMAKLSKEATGEDIDDATSGQLIEMAIERERAAKAMSGWTFVAIVVAPTALIGLLVWFSSLLT